MDTRLYQFLSVTFSPAYAEEATRRIAARRNRDTTVRVQRLLTIPADQASRRDDHSSS